jgi:hypothetical protein
MDVDFAPDGKAGLLGTMEHSLNTRMEPGRCSPVTHGPFRFSIDFTGGHGWTVGLTLAK